MPRLALPFALVGAAAGWLSTDLFDNPLLDYTPSGSAPVAAGAAAVIAALVGKAVQRRAEPDNPWIPPSAVWPAVIALVLLGGGAVGAFVGGLAFDTDRGIYQGFLGGLAGALLFLPVCVLVITAARRAARARLGSLVAAADHRELWAAMLAALAAATGLAFPDWPAGRPPRVALAAAVLSLLVTAALFALDLRTAARVRGAALAAGRMERREAPLDEVDPALPAVDLGLGEELHAEVVRGAAYRSQDRTGALVLGSVSEALAAMRRALGVKAVAVLVALSAVAGHLVADTRAAHVAFEEVLCRRGEVQACGFAAQLLAFGGAPDHQRAVELGAHACDAFEPAGVAGCRVVAQILERDPARADAGMRLHARERACGAGDGESCGLVHELALAGAVEVTRYQSMRRACGEGDRASCEVARAMHSPRMPGPEE